MNRILFNFHFPQHVSGKKPLSFPDFPEQSIFLCVRLTWTWLLSHPHTHGTYGHILLEKYMGGAHVSPHTYGTQANLILEKYMGEAYVSPAHSRHHGHLLLEKDMGGAHASLPNVSPCRIPCSKFMPRTLMIYSQRQI